MTRGDGAEVGEEQGWRLLEVVEAGPLLRPLCSGHHRGGGRAFLPGRSPDTFEAGCRITIFLSDSFQLLLSVIGTENYQGVLTAFCVGVGAPPEFHLS